MFCSISGETPQDPVVSVKSGSLYERRLIEKHIQEYGSEPGSGEPLTLQDLVSVKSSKAVKPRPLQAASVPGILALLQNEWDALMLANHQLEQQLHTARQELSHSLYQHDAACRVIAHLKKERDEATTLLATIQVESAPAQQRAQAGEVAAVAANGKRAMEDGTAPDGEARQKRPRMAGLPANVISELAECNAALTAARKKRQVPPTLTPAERLSNFTQLGSHPLHKTSKPGILALDVHRGANLVASAGLDATAIVFDVAAGRIRGTLTGHSKRVTSVRFVSSTDSGALITASADKTVRIWAPTSGGSSYECRHVMTEHTGEVKAVTVHASGKYFVSASADKSWAFYDLAAGACLTLVEEGGLAEGYTAAALHPDGLILGTGTGESLVRIWDVKSAANVAKFEGHSGPVTAMAFSENGYFLATAATDGVKLWDLRKLKNFRNLAPYDANTPTNTVEFDHSGSYLAVGGGDVRVYSVASVKQEWPLIKTFPDLSGTGKVTSVQFGPDASYLAVASMDRNLRIFGSPDVQPGGGEDS